MPPEPLAAAQPAPSETPYPPIGDYALLADCHAAALVSRSGSLDWACVDRFDGPSVFGRILDWDRGGRFSLSAVDVTRSARRYVGGSLVLETTVETATGTARIRDAYAMRRGGGRDPLHQILRVLEGVSGEVAFDVTVEPRFDYGELRPWITQDARTGTYTAVGGATALVISGCEHLDLDEAEARLSGRVGVAAGERLGFAVQYWQPHRLPGTGSSQQEILHRLAETQVWWDRWSSNTEAQGPYADAMLRSAVVLKGLTCAPTGAIVAAPTTSLPEEVGGERNWDYRYSWVRDSTLTMAAMCLVGHEEVARGFRDFIMRSASGRAEDLQILYGAYGERYLPEVVLHELSGWRGSAPVRIGNGAARQVQHDVYGHILDAATLWREAQQEMDPAEWRFLRRLVERACEVWREPDKGIWEVRSGPRHFVASKVMLWVALDRGIRTVENSGSDDIDLDRWRSVRAAIRDEVMTKGVSDEGYFSQSYGSEEVDAALLMLPLVGFIPADDERMVRTVERIRADLSLGEDGFVRRYRTEDVEVGDGLSGHEGVFLMCSFWLVQVLALQGARVEATALFERLLAVSGDLGLYAEEYDTANAEMLGNFPQAFTHMALIAAAHRLHETEDEALDVRQEATYADQVRRHRG